MYDLCFKYCRNINQIWLIVVKQNEKSTKYRTFKTCVHKVHVLCADKIVDLKTMRISIAKIYMYTCYVRNMCKNMPHVLIPNYAQKQEPRIYEFTDYVLLAITLTGCDVT